MTKWTIEDVAARFEEAAAPVDGCLPFECRVTSTAGPPLSETSGRPLLLTRGLSILSAESRRD